MNSELAHSFNIVLDSEISERIKGIQKKLSNRFNERRFYDSSPHVSILTKFMFEDKTKDFVGSLEREFKNDKAWELEFSAFVISDNGTYIFLNFSKESTAKIFELNKRAQKAAKGVGTLGMNGEPKPRYSFYPHLSIIKLEENETKEAIKMIKNDLKGVKMRVRKYEITAQEDDEKGFANFPTIKEVMLQ